jgi:hypothetical protein
MLANAAHQFEKGQTNTTNTTNTSDTPPDTDRDLPTYQQPKGGPNLDKNSAQDRPSLAPYEDDKEAASEPNTSPIALRRMARGGGDEKKWTATSRTLLFTIENPALIVFAGLLSWILVGGVLMQKLILASCLPSDPNLCPEPSYAEGIYYGVQAGLGVGFGLLRMKESPWRLLAIFWSLVGATCILAALSLLIDIENKKLLETLVKVDNEDDGDKCCKNKVWTAPFHALHRVIFHHLNMSIFVLLYLIWLWVGVLWTCMYYKFSVITGLTFSFFAMSTAGLQPPGDTRDVGLLLTTAYVIIGVPLFAALCSLVITKIKGFYVRARRKRVELLNTRRAYRQRRMNLVSLKKKVRGTKRQNPQISTSLTKLTLSAASNKKEHFKISRKLDTGM